MNAHQEVRRLLDQIRVVSNNPAVIKASDQIEVLTGAYMSDGVSEDELRSPLNRVLSQNLNRLFLALLNRRGQTVTKQCLMDAIYFDQREEPEMPILGVLICNLKKRIAHTEYAGTIENVWGTGYRMKTESEMTQDKAA